MPSLKDLRNRIASVKATQKDHQGHANGRGGEAAACAGGGRSGAAPMPSAWRRYSPISPPASAPALPPPPLLTGTGQDTRHLLIVLHRRAGPLRRLQFVDRAARARAREMPCWHRARQSSSSASARRDMTNCGGSSEKDILELIDLRGVRVLGFEQADSIARNILARFAADEFDIATLFFSRFRSVIAQIPTALQIIPALHSHGGGEAGVGKIKRSTNTSPPKTRFSNRSCRAISRCRFSAPCLKMPPQNKAPA